MEAVGAIAPIVCFMGAIYIFGPHDFGDFSDRMRTNSLAAHV